MSILDFLGFKSPAPTEQLSDAKTQTVRKIVAQLDRLPPERARFVAAFAYILSRVAHADLEICSSELDVMEQLVIEHGELPPDQAKIVVEMAKEQALLFGGTENYLVTREFGSIATRDEKMHMIECMFWVSAADQSITAAESRAIRQVADELMLEHSDYIAVRSEFREHLDVLKKPDDSSES